MPNKTELPEEEIQKNLLAIVEHFEEEDRSVYERQVIKYKRLKLYWDNIFQVYYSEVAHDWRIPSDNDDNGDQSYYDKPINTFKAYIETIIAALSVTTPAVKCFPEDAESTLDTITAKAGDKIGQLVGRHNNYQLLWLKALYTYYTEGTVYCYSYPRANDKYGTYETEKREQVEETKFSLVCATCGQQTEIDSPINEFQPEMQIVDLCSNCGQLTNQSQQQQTFVRDKLVGKDKHPKSRVCLDVYGGLYVKIANYAKTPEQTPYLRLAYETHYVNAIEEFEHLYEKENLRKNINAYGGVSNDTYSQIGRLNTLYMGDSPTNVVTIRRFWLRPCAFNILGEIEDVKKLKALYPRGVKVCLVDDEFGSAEPQNLDDYWTISINPTEDFLTHDAAGETLVNTQEITNDIISLVLQTIEAGIGSTFADPGVLNFKAYKESEAIPGGVYEATAKSGKGLSDGFYQVKTATLSAEIIPFFNMIQSLAQLVSGALPSLFGGELSGSKTASEYSMSRAQALQRVQNTWKIFTSWWKEVQGKVIPLYINNMKSDEKDVDKLPDGSFINIFIRMSELQGKIGKVELEAAENLPLTWVQQKETIMKMIEAQNDVFLQMIQAPENIPILRDSIGLVNFHIPGEDDRSKQNDEIKELLASEPIENPDAVDEMGNPAMPMPSVEVDPIYDNHAIQFEIVRQWAISEAGRLAKIENEPGYQNVLLHGQMHQMIQMQQMMQQQQQQQEAENPEKPAKSNRVSGEEDVATNV